MNRASLVWYGIARGLVEVFCRLFFRVRITGREHVPSSGPYILAPVHRSNVDTLLCGCLTRRRVRFMGKDSLWRYRVTGALFSSLGGFPVHREAADRTALRRCEEVLRAGEPVVLFPEGTRRAGPLVHDLMQGAAFVAARTEVPIVPVGIGGSEWAMPKGSRRLRPVKVAMRVGPPIPPPAPGPAGPGGHKQGPAGPEGHEQGPAGPEGHEQGHQQGAARVSRREVTAVTARLHDELQRLFDQALADAGREPGDPGVPNG